MKKILLAVTAALAITGCSQNEEFDVQNQNAEINFTTTVGKSIRAAEADITTLQTNGFKLYAYNTGEKEMANVTSLDAATITETLSYKDNAWNFTTGPYYWPLNENLQFFGYSPATPTLWTATGQWPTFKYEVQTEQEDLLAVATLNKKKTASAAFGSVQLTFKHILTQINFKLTGKDAGFDYSVTKITISEVYPEGTYTYNGDKGSWVTGGTTKAYEYAITSPVKVAEQAEVSLGTGNNSLMLIPQAVTAIQVSVEYSTTLKGDTKSVYSGEKTVTLTGSAWGVGQKILYTVTLPSGAEEISVSPTVDPWNGGAENPGTTTE